MAFIDCFSDNTHRDFVANQKGIAALWKGNGEGMRGIGLLGLARAKNAALAKDIDAKIEAATKAIGSIPTPFDATLLAKDGSPGRKALLAAIEALEAQAESLGALAIEFGFEIPLEPGAGR